LHQNQKVVIVTLLTTNPEDTVKSRDLIKEVERAGWVLVRIKGSHHQFKHPDHKLPLTIPHPKKDLKIGLVKDIMKQAGL
jgi:predicted RNA binding protein YcfA (HicA-like mRNA interferase family)